MPQQYRATLCHTQFSKATVTITAKDAKEAIRKANKIDPEDVPDWNPFDGYLDVVWVDELVDKEKSTKPTRRRSAR